MQSLARALASAAAASWFIAACTSEAPPTPAAASCERGLDALLEDAGVVPAPRAPLYLAPLVYGDTTLTGVPGRVIDHDPLARGEHTVQRYWLHPTRCELAGGWYSWAPPPLWAEPLEPDPGPTLGETDHPTAAIRALVVTGADVGAADDALAWHHALAALGARAPHLHAPTRDAVEEALGDLCAGLDGVPGEVAALLVTAGRGTATGDGALLLDGEAISWRRIATLLAARCADLGLLVWVVDASHAGALVDGPAPPMPTRLFVASGPDQPDAPRAAPSGGGALGRALAGAVADRARGRCLAHVRPMPGDVAEVFEIDDLEERVRAIRWEAVGEPALLSAALADGLPAGSRQATIAALDAGVPRRLGATFGDLPVPTRCATDSHCASYASDCPRDQCAAARCEAGACVPVAATGRVCDDDNPCTTDDQCRAAGDCAGLLLDCDDGDPCTDDGCEVAADGCVHTTVPDATVCDDGDACTTADTCQGGQCTGGPLACDDDDPCTVDTCDPLSGCNFVEANLPCDDEDACTSNDYCHDGVCDGVRKQCTDGSPCTVDDCDPATGVCLFPAVADGVLCDDGDPCTDHDHCEAGACVGSAETCDDDDDCTLDSCVTGVCQHLPIPGFCSVAGECVPVGAQPAAEPCRVCQATGVVAPDPALEGAGCPDDGVACTLDRCQDGQCVHPNVAGTCTTPAGGCVAVGEPLTPCLFCSATGVGAPAGVGSPCDDGDPCTVDDSCSEAGLCQGVASGCCPAGEALVCGASVSGDTSLPDTPQVITFWECLPSTPFGGPERAHAFQAPCQGLVTFELAGSVGGMLLLLVRGDTTVCGEGACSTYTGGKISQLVDEGEPLTLVVDQNYLAGPYTISATCKCDEPAP